MHRPEVEGTKGPLEVDQMEARPSKRLPLFKEMLALVLGTYLAVITFVFAYLLWRSITIHLADASLQIAILALFALLATAAGGYAASWFNSYRYSKLLGLSVGVVLYLAAVMLVVYSPDNFRLVLPFFNTSVPIDLATALPSLVAGTLGGWSAHRISQRHS
jgi:hypothetical protein